MIAADMENVANVLLIMLLMVNFPHVSFQKRRKKHMIAVSMR